jgi:hypothetical protein
MQKEGEESKCKPPLVNGVFDCDGELHRVPDTSEKIYFPSWAKPKEGWNVVEFYQTTEDLEWVSGLENVRNWYFMFYRAHTKTKTTEETHGFELFFVICAITLIFFWKRKRIWSQ